MNAQVGNGPRTVRNIGVAAGLLLAFAVLVVGVFSLTHQGWVEFGYAVAGLLLWLLCAAIYNWANGLTARLEAIDTRLAKLEARIDRPSPSRNDARRG